MEIVEKHHATQAVFGVDFTNRLASGETLSSGAAFTVVEAKDGGATADITISGASISGTRVVGTVSGGKCLITRNGRYECRYYLRAIVTTSASERESDCVELVVYDCEEQSAVYS